MQKGKLMHKSNRSTIVQKDNKGKNQNEEKRGVLVDKKKL